MTGWILIVAASLGCAAPVYGWPGPAEFCDGLAAGSYCSVFDALHVVHCPSGTVTRLPDGRFCAFPGPVPDDYIGNGPYDPSYYCGARAQGTYCLPGDVSKGEVLACPSGKSFMCPIDMDCVQKDELTAKCMPKPRPTCSTTATATTTATGCPTTTLTTTTKTAECTSTVTNPATTTTATPGCVTKTITVYPTTKTTATSVRPTTTKASTTTKTGTTTTSSIHSLTSTSTKSITKTQTVTTTRSTSCRSVGTTTTALRLWPRRPVMAVVTRTVTVEPIVQPTVAAPKMLTMAAPMPMVSVPVKEDSGSKAEASQMMDRMERFGIKIVDR